MKKCCVKDNRYRNGSLFKLPRNVKNEWEIAHNRNLKRSSRICATTATHFNVEDIITIWESAVGANKYILSTF